MQLIHCAARQMGKPTHERSAHRIIFFGAGFADMGVMRGVGLLSFDGVF